MYLIIKCEQLNDQFECDADREPITLTEDWKAWYNATSPNYCFEVYEFQNDKFVLVKDFYTPMECGMSLHFWTEEQMKEGEYNTPTVRQKWIGASRNDPMPKEVLTLATQYYEDTVDTMMQELSACGQVGWEDDEGNWWVYGEFHDRWYSMGA